MTNKIIKDEIKPVPCSDTIELTFANELEKDKYVYTEVLEHLKVDFTNCMDKLKVAVNREDISRKHYEEQSRKMLEDISRKHYEEQSRKMLEKTLISLDERLRKKRGVKVQKKEK